MKQFPQGWNEEQGKLVKQFQFSDFKEAITFVNKVAQLAEEANHHPDIEVFGYNNVRLRLSTHDSGSITEKDVILAEKINTL